MRETENFNNDGESIYKLNAMLSDTIPFSFNKDKKNTYIGLYCMENIYTKTKYRWLTTFEYEILKALKPHLYIHFRKCHMDFIYDTYSIEYLSESQFKTTYISPDQQKVKIRLNRWSEITYKYTAKFNLAGLIKQLQATHNLVQTYKQLEYRPSIIQVLTQIYYNPNYILIFMKNPIEYLAILQDTDFYHYFKMLHPETTYTYKHTIDN